MKFNLTINDIEMTELGRVINALNVISAPTTLTGASVSENDIVLTNEPIVPVEGDFEQPAPFEPAFDKNGLPWDARIHSSNHKLTDKGVWQRRRGITDIEFENVKNELLGLAPEPTAPVAPLPVEPVAPVAPQPQVVAPAPLQVFPAFVSPVAQPTTPVAQPTTPVAQPTPTAPAQPDADTLFKTMFDKVKAAMAAGAIKANDVQALIATVNNQFGTQYQTLAAVRDNIEVLQFIINDLVSKGF